MVQVVCNNLVKTISQPFNADNSLVIPQETNTAQYRLHIITATESYYSNAISVKTSCGNKESFTILPNPVNSNNIGNVHIRYVNQESITNSSLMIYDAEGRLIVTKAIVLQIGLNEFQLPKNNLTRGVYLIRLQHSGEVVKLNVF